MVRAESVISFLQQMSHTNLSHYSRLHIVRSEYVSAALLLMSIVLDRVLLYKCVLVCIYHSVFDSLVFFHYQARSNTSVAKSA